VDELKEVIQNGYLIPLDQDIRIKFILKNLLTSKHTDLVYHWRE
jgi:hypothetical protein